MLYSLPVLMCVRCCSVMPSLLYNRVVDELLQWSPYCSYIVLTRDRSQGLGTMCVSILHILHVYVYVCVCVCACIGAYFFPSTSMCEMCIVVLYHVWCGCDSCACVCVGGGRG